ncbi:hypothetical protein KRP22_008440 [Phytophthora ramorum]|uniref:Uracil phosphoribosyltransferase n=1 Tax=Phytophthora ramorum TaxID=164328 RepID=UPI0030B7B0C6|nr:Uracil phosphoribosyltransferase [Phytophthora ramorum]KAH7494994.1 Uracil phosphoribosyltransferase [Phytophthora ramorum]
MQPPTADTSIKAAISALTRHFESQLHKRRLSSSEDCADMTSFPRPNRFDLAQEERDAQPNPLPTYERFSRPPSQGGDTAGRESPVQVIGDLSPTAPRRERTSRYLSEGARKEIIARIDGGEKQVALAKEFDVSRAAICNLYKNRWEVLTRGVRDPTATHPKKSRKKASLQRASPASSTTTQASAVAAEPSTNYLGMSPTSIRASTSPLDGHVQDPYHSQQNEPQQQGLLQWPEAQIQVAHRNLLQDEVEPRPRDRRAHHVMTADSPVASKRFLVHEASAYSYPCRNLVATLRNERISTPVFQQRTMRLARLLIEEVLTCLPHDEEEITNTYGDRCHTMKALDASDFCAVSMEDKGLVLLRAFSDISPGSYTGVVTIDKETTEDTGCNASPRIYSQLPPIQPRQFVLLLDVECAAGNKACSVLHHLVRVRQIPAKNIYFVSIISAFEGLQNVFRYFPDVCLVTAQVDTVLDDQQCIRPGIGDFVQRYWNVNPK